MNISFRQIRSFLAAAKLGSFTRAADSLFITQPALTIQIRNMEEALEVRLFDRNTRNVTLTRVGASLLPVFERMVTDLDSVVSEAREIVALRRGIVRIALLPSVAAAILPSAIKEFRALYPGASFLVHDLIDSQIIEQVRAGVVDIGITGGDIDDKSIRLLHKKSESLKVIFPQGHPLSSFATIGIHDLAEFPLITLNASTSVRTVVEEAFARAGLTPINGCEATYMMTVASMVSAGLGIAVLPASAQEDYAFPDLSRALVNDIHLRRNISIITLSDKTLPPMSQLFCEYLIQNFEK